MIGMYALCFNNEKLSATWRTENFSGNYSRGRVDMERQFGNLEPSGRQAKHPSAKDSACPAPTSFSLPSLRDSAFLFLERHPWGWFRRRRFPLQAPVIKESKGRVRWEGGGTVEEGGGG